MSFSFAFILPTTRCEVRCDFCYYQTGHSPHVEEADYLEPLFEHYRPDALPLIERYREQGRASTTRYRLQTLQVELLTHQLECGEYPPMEAGLAAVIEVDNFMHEGLTHDGWGQVFLYSRPDAWTYTVRSIGADGERGTADDWVLTSEGDFVRGDQVGGEETAADAATDTSASVPPAFLTVEHLADLEPGERLFSAEPGSDGSEHTLRIEGEELVRILRGGEEVAAVSVRDELIAVSDLGSHCFLTEVELATMLVSGDDVLLLESSWADADYLAGTDTLIYSDGDS
ncbi:MAG: hypothetical protein GY884_19545, partial [Proteobacteria bacterium]|nr:hypothetical protein [Pseudomonadota bacterium]